MAIPTSTIEITLMKDGAVKPKTLDPLVLVRSNCKIIVNMLAMRLKNVKFDTMLPLKMCLWDEGNSLDVLLKQSSWWTPEESSTEKVLCKLDLEKPFHNVNWAFFTSR